MPLHKNIIVKKVWVEDWHNKCDQLIICINLWVNLWTDFGRFSTFKCAFRS